MRAMQHKIDQRRTVVSKSQYFIALGKAVMRYLKPLGTRDVDRTNMNTAISQ
jgi:hypothetical protein